MRFLGCYLLQNADEKPQKNTSGDSSDAPREWDEKKLKIDQTTAASCGKQVAKAAKDGTQIGDAFKEAEGAKLQIVTVLQKGLKEKRLGREWDYFKKLFQEATR